LGSLAHTVGLPTYEEAIKEAKVEDMAELERLYKERKVVEFRQKVRRLYTHDLIDKNLRELRDMGRDMRITNWSRLDKAMMIDAIKRRQSNEEV
jgi:hypothetical protein